MTLIHWVGAAVSDNAKTTRHRGGQTANAGAYIAYKQSVAWTIRSQAAGVRLGRPGLFVQFRLEGHHDAANLLKGLLDGIQDSGIVANDRHIAPVMLLETLPHARGLQDEAWLGFWEKAR